MNSNLVSGWAVAEEAAGGSGSGADPSHTLRPPRLSTHSRWSQGAASGETLSLELRQVPCSEGSEELGTPILAITTSGTC